MVFMSFSISDSRNSSQPFLQEQLSDRDQQPTSFTFMDQGATSQTNDETIQGSSTSGSISSAPSEPNALIIKLRGFYVV